MKIGNHVFNAGQPVLYIDSAKTSSMEGAATTVYATGGRGNARLIAWEGERTLTFTVEDALLSPVSFAMLSGAGVVKGLGNEKVHFHQTSRAIITNDTFENGQVTSGGNTVDKSGYIEWSTIDLTDAVAGTEKICPTAPVYIIKLDEHGDLTGEVDKGWTIFNTSYNRDNNNAITGLNYDADFVTHMGWLSSEVTANVNDATGYKAYEDALAPYAGKVMYKKHKDVYINTADQNDPKNNTDYLMTPTAAGLETVMVDYYVIKPSKAVTELQIDMKKFGGYYYVEADTLFRRQSDGKDLPANLTFPNVKIQSNFTFSMAASGDPSERMRLAA